MRARSSVAILLILIAATRATAIINCFDYAFYRATGVDPRPPASVQPEGIGFTGLQCYLAAMGYTQVPGPARSDSDLVPGDVLLFGTAHAGFVTPAGTIDHFIQVWSTSGDKHSSHIAAGEILSSRRPIDFPDPPGGKHTGNFIGHTLAQFMGSAFIPSGEVYRWRKTGSATISANDILRIEVSLIRAEAAIGSGKFSDAETALSDAKSVTGA